MIFRKFTVMQPTPLLSHNLESFLGKIWNWPPYTESKERPEKGRGHSRLIGGKCTKQGSLQSEFVSGTTRQADLSIYYQNLQSLYRDLNEVQPLSQSRWSHQHIALLRLCSWKGSLYENSGQNIHSEDRGRGEEPPVAQTQLSGQLAVRSSGCHPPAITI